MRSFSRTGISNRILATLTLFLPCLMICANLATAESKKPDNAAVNQRIQENVELTAQDQSSGPADIAITRQIRKDLMADDALSTYGQNIKIITQNGNITLKGPVRTSGEKLQIEKIALRAQGAKRVMNELEVAPRR